MIYRFANCVLDCRTRELVVGTAAIHLEPQVFDVLRYLLENRERVVSRDELITAVWQGRIVSDATVGTRIFAARNAVGDTGIKQTVIRTLPRRGFRFVATVQAEEPAHEAVLDPPAESRLPCGIPACSDADVTEIARPKPGAGTAPPRAVPDQPVSSESPRLRLVTIASCFLLLLFAGGLYISTRLPEAPLKAASPERLAFPLPGKPSIAVLPFANLDRAAAQDLLGEGLTDSLVNALARNPSLFVIAHSSTAPYAGVPAAAVRAAEELGVRYIVEGSLKRDGDDVRVKTRLVDAFNGSVVWAERYERTTADLLALEEEVTARIARSLDVRINHGNQPSSGGTRMIDASTAYLQGRHEYLAFTPEGNSRAQGHYLRALKLDPDYAEVMVALANTYFIEMIRAPADDWGGSLARIAELQADAARIAPGMPRLFELRSLLALTRGDYDLALTEAEAMAAVDPNGAQSHYVLGRMYFFMGQYERAIDSLESAERINPGDRASYSSHLAFSQLALGRGDVAVSILEGVAARWPDFSPGHAFLAIAYQLAGRASDARQQAARLADVAPHVRLFALERRFLPMQDRALADRFIEAARQVGIPS